MITAWLRIPPHARRQLVSGLEAGILSLPVDEASVQRMSALRDHTTDVVAIVNKLHRMGLSARACGAWLSTAEQVVMRGPRYDLVWSGPDAPGVHARSTRRVYTELFDSVQESIWVSSFVYFDGPKIFEPLARRLDAHPQLQVFLLLNIQRNYGDTSRPEELVYRFAHKFWTEDWPGTARPTVYYDPRSVEKEGTGGVLHAKGVVADGKTVFITSANLTEAALDRNIELGLLVRDAALARSVTNHFRSLIDHKLLRRLPIV